MKTVYLLRHGPALPHGTPGIADDDRPLTEKGREKVRTAAEGLQVLDLGPDRIVSSPLPRARETAEIAAEIMGLTDRLEFADALHANRSVESIAAWLAKQPDGSLMLVGHNPWISRLVPMLAGAGPNALTLDLRKPGAAKLIEQDGGRYALKWLLAPHILRTIGE